MLERYQRRTEVEYLLAAEVSTRGGIVREGFKNAGPLVGVCLRGIGSKLSLESNGGVASVWLVTISSESYEG